MKMTTTTMAITTKVGTVMVCAPDYSVPGIAEQVEAEVAAGELADSSSSNLIYALWRHNRRTEFVRSQRADTAPS